MSWSMLPPYEIKRLHKDVFNKIKQLQSVVMSKLNEYGYTDITYNQFTASYDTQIYAVLSALTSVEDNFDSIEEYVPMIEYDEPHSIGTTFSLAEYQRWWRLLNELYETVFEVKRPWGQVVLLGEDGEPDMQIDGNDVYIRGDEFE